VLIFTQFAEIIDPLARYLESLFGTPGLTLSGSVSVKKRREAVERFQSDEYVLFFILSLKAGSVGLNLTAANHVIHFDRWWNPAVENQATDRAFRIGQKKNVMVHKFVCTGTIEERIDALIEDKKGLAQKIIPAAAENWTTEMDDRRKPGPALHRHHRHHLSAEKQPGCAGREKPRLPRFSEDAAVG
jgi:non-specific serine/threonine protein kinase